MLFKLLDFIQREEIVSEQQLTRTFKITTQTLQPMLERWIKRGMIKKLSPTPSCKSVCTQCNETTLNFYQSNIQS
jgi:predicted HTH transcriptional regulator